MVLEISVISNQALSDSLINAKATWSYESLIDFFWLIVYRLFFVCLPLKSLFTDKVSRLQCIWMDALWGLKIY